MSDMNVLNFTGRLGADPIKRTFPNGDSIVSLNVAITDQWRDKTSGEKKERTTWLTVVINNNGLAKTAENFLQKGSRVGISAKLQSRQYEKDGETRTVMEAIIGPFNGSLTLIDGAKGDRQGGAQERQPQRSSAPAFDADDSIPF